MTTQQQHQRPTFQVGDLVRLRCAVWKRKLSDAAACVELAAGTEFRVVRPGTHWPGVCDGWICREQQGVGEMYDLLEQWLEPATDLAPGAGSLFD